MQVIRVVGAVVIFGRVRGFRGTGHVVGLILEHIVQTADATGLQSENRRKLIVRNVRAVFIICNDGIDLIERNRLTVV